MALIRTIAEIKQYVRVNFANGSSSLPNMERPARKYIVPVLGQPLYDDVVAKYVAADPNPTFKVLLTRVQAALAPLAYFLELPLINTQITDIGLMKSTNAQMQPVFKHDFDKVLSTLYDQGMDEIEQLLTFLDANKADYPLWADGEGYDDYRQCIVRTGQDFSKIYTLLHPRRCYLLLRPSILMVQEQYVEASIGVAFLNELQEKEAPSAEEKDVILLLKKSVVFLSIQHASASLSVRLTESGFTVQAADADLADSSRVAADGESIRRMAQDAERLGNAYLANAKKYLNQKATATVFATYFASPYYQDPGVKKPSLNSQLKSTFTL